MGTSLKKKWRVKMVFTNYIFRLSMKGANCYAVLKEANHDQLY